MFIYILQNWQPSTRLQISPSFSNSVTSKFKNRWKISIFLDSPIAPGTFSESFSENIVIKLYQFKYFPQNHHQLIMTFWQPWKFLSIIFVRYDELSSKIDGGVVSNFLFLTFLDFWRLSVISECGFRTLTFCVIEEVLLLINNII